MQIKQLGYEKQKGLKGQIVNVPIPISKTIRALPRLNHEMETFQLYIYISNEKCHTRIIICVKQFVR